MMTKLFVAAGGTPQWSGGDTSSPSQVYRRGMGLPALNAELVSSKAIGLPTRIIHDGSSRNR
jgi:hypothetical protein